MIIMCTLSHDLSLHKSIKPFPVLCLYTKKDEEGLKWIHTCEIYRNRKREGCGREKARKGCERRGMVGIDQVQEVVEARNVWS